MQYLWEQFFKFPNFITLSRIIIRNFFYHFSEKKVFLLHNYKKIFFCTQNHINCDKSQ